MSISWVPGPVLHIHSSVHYSSRSHVIDIVRKNVQFADEKVKAQTSYTICPKSQKVADTGNKADSRV